MIVIDKIIEMFKSAAIDIDSSQAEKFSTLFEFMVEYNRNVNLTAITEFSEVVMKHFIDSVLPFTMIETPDESRFIDVGTGAGFPSLPLLIMRPDLHGTLCDSLQ
ncbi:MAG: class I SAM-dependent methyltransferase, partial [Oscillospiraceae bacterium]|nr:class I SAM-dependent methyltransferase [Oscillospiraceae bacterium]